jgi:rare lipoprotein A
MHVVFINTISVIIIGFTLVGCSTTPSTRAVNEICTGTKKNYTVQGKSYYPQNHYDYEEEGVASWYGPGFHKRSTSCGSIYNMHAYTAAHKTLPIPTVVEVTNVETGKNLKLVVNDRGPFVNDRIIDLSKKAAQELGTHNKGLATVRVRAIPEESKALADYLKQYGRYGIDPSGRQWDEIYFQEIAGKVPVAEDTNEEDTNKVVPAVFTKEITPQPMIQKAALYREQPQELSQPVSLTQDDEEMFEELMAMPAHPQSQPQSHPQSQPQVAKPAVVRTLAPSPAPKGGHFIQVGSFVQKQNADHLKRALEKYGKTTVIQDRRAGNLYSIKLGPYPNRQLAQQKLTLVANEGHRGARLMAN